jgi:hypothetical protein
MTPGKFIFLRSPIAVLFSIRHDTSPVEISVLRTVKTNDPSATNICCPAVTDFAMDGYEHAIFLQSPL